MDHLPSQNQTLDRSSGTTEGAPLVDLRHLGHQTMGDLELERIVLGLFLEEAPRYAADLLNARDTKAWRLAVHTLKGVTLNLGAFRLAELCKRHELLEVQASYAPLAAPARSLADLLDLTAGHVRTILNSGRHGG